MAETELICSLKKFQTKRIKLTSEVETFLNAKLIEAGKPEWIPKLNLDEKLALLYNKLVYSADNDRSFEIYKSYITQNEWYTIYIFLKTIQ